MSPCFHRLQVKCLHKPWQQGHVQAHCMCLQQFHAYVAAAASALQCFLTATAKCACYSLLHFLREPCSDVWCCACCTLKVAIQPVFHVQSCTLYAEPGSSLPTKMERRVAPPAYQTTEGGAFKLNLSCMMDGIGHDDDAVDAIKAIDILAGEWPSDVLQEVTTLDQSQLLAVQVTLSCMLHKCTMMQATFLISSDSKHQPCSLT